MTLHEINCKYLSIFDPLFRAEGKRPDKYFTWMSNTMMKLCEQEVEDYLDERMLTFSIQRFERKFKVKMYTPRRLFLSWNKTAKKLLKRYKAEFATFLAELEKEIKEEKKYAEELEQKRASAPSVPKQQLPEGQSTALTVPSETDVAPQDKKE